MCIRDRDGYVLIEDGLIAAVGNGRYLADPDDRTENEGSPAPVDERVDGAGGILMPGMVNVHSHISMIPFRSMGDDCRDRLRRFLFPLELAAMNPEPVSYTHLDVYKRQTESCVRSQPTSWKRSV